MLYTKLVLMALFWSGVFPAINIVLSSMGLFISVFLRFWFAARRLSANTDIGRAYDRLRLRVLSTILATSPGGYRTDDARFLAGEIQWKAQRPDEAVRLWREMRPGPEDAYHLSAQRVQDAIATTPPNASRVSQALRDQEGRWWMASVDRLRQFGYRPNRY